MLVRSLFAVFFGIAAVTGSATAAEDARVLPAGRTRLSAGYAQSGEVSRTFNNWGHPESLTADYQFDLDYRNLSTFNQEMARLIDGLNAFDLRYDASARGSNTHGITTDPSMPLLGDAFSRGHLGVDAIAERHQYSFTLQHGITDRLSVGLMVPYLRTTVDVSYAFTGSNTAADIRAGLGTRRLDTPLDNLLTLIASSDAETFQQILKERGYSRFEDRTTYGIGDMAFGGRYNYLSSKKFINSIQFGSTVPTGRMSMPSELTEVHNGQGAWDIGFAHLLNYTPNRRLMFSQGIHYTHALPATRIKRVRENEKDAMPLPSSDERVDVQLGEKAWVTAGAAYKLTNALTFDTGYEWYWKTRDRFRGNRNKDYTHLSDITDKYLETVQAGVGISTIPSFMKKDFPIPAEILVNVYWPIRGRNAIIAPYGTAELALYF